MRGETLKNPIITGQKRRAQILCCTLLAQIFEFHGRAKTPVVIGVF
ncbi:hypothetical protein MICA_31 [Micavibrio aeruginosavorus ARL-13]|uniref:Uncharacterized protein n=1 Tax=Micavibrio aeruginosavorus (strain ARL-13) TaxID=856793 RepID=G2KLE3_MICAA|nr:hypothetical protein MICA_31 [Micavibrio aeruginosavorus ARL-13]